MIAHAAWPVSWSLTSSPTIPAATESHCPRVPSKRILRQKLLSRGRKYVDQVGSEPAESTPYFN